MDDASPTGNNPRHRPAPARPHQHHVRAAEVRDHLDMLAHVPPDFSTAMGLVHEFLVAAGLKFGPVVGQDIGRNDFGIVFQQAQGTAEPNAVHDEGIRHLDAKFGKQPHFPQAVDGLLDGQARPPGKIAIRVDRHADAAHDFPDVHQHRKAGAVVDLAQHDAANGNIVALPIKLQGILGRIFGEPDAKGGQRKPDQVGIEVEVQPGQHRDDRRPHIVVGPSGLFPVPFVEHLAEELARTHLLCVGHRPPVELVDVLGGPVVGVYPPCPVTHRGVGVEVHDASTLLSRHYSR